MGILGRLYRTAFRPEPRRWIALRSQLAPRMSPNRNPNRVKELWTLIVRRGVLPTSRDLIGPWMIPFLLLGSLTCPKGAMNAASGAGPKAS